MHERSLVRSLLTQVEQLQTQNGAVAVDTVHVEIGPLSGVEPVLLAGAFEELAGDVFEPQPTLQIDTVPLQIRCRSCGRESSVGGLTLRCPECASSRVHVVRGDELRLIDVGLQVPVTSEGDIP